MLVVAKRDTFIGCPKKIKDAGYLESSQTLITVGTQYEVFALALFAGVPMLQIINDLGYPVWLPSWLFQVTDMLLPSDFLCNLLESELEMIIGPDFVSRDEDSYRRMVELDPTSVDAFWKRVNDRRFE